MPKPIHSHAQYLPGLDGLRACAVIAVILYHLNFSWIPGGFLGVGIFFTLSGYLITMNLMGSWNRSHSLELSTFWFRRFRRLLPAVAVVLITVLVLTATLDLANLGERCWEALTSFFYVNNWYNIFAHQSYFSQFGGPGPLSHMWSLSVEEQFYLIWPVLLLLFLTVIKRETLLIWATIFLSLGSFAWMAHISVAVGDNTRAYEGTDTRAGGILIGAALAVWLSLRTKENLSIALRPKYAEIVGFLGLAILSGLVFFCSTENYWLYQYGFLILSVATVMLIMAIIQQHSLVGRVCSVKPLQWIGMRSYGLYLWHIPVIAFLPLQWRTWTGPWYPILVISISLLLAALSWSLVEDPIRKHGLSAYTQRKTVDGEQCVNTVKHPTIKQYCIRALALILVAVVLLGAPRILLNDQTGENALNQQMEVPEEVFTLDEEKIATTSTVMSCEKVIHVGDSTSIGMFSDVQLPYPEDNANFRYIEFGAQEVQSSVFGARSTTEGWQEYPSAVESVKDLVENKQPKNTCWVIATGVNDAANISAGAHDPNALARINEMMDLLPDQKVMWVNTMSDLTTGHWAQKNMQAFNDALLEAQKEYPNLKIYDWASDVRPEWFLVGDGIHYNATGNAQRAVRFAQALAILYPENGKGPKITTVNAEDAQAIVDRTAQEVKAAQRAEDERIQREATQKAEDAKTTEPKINNN